MRDPIETLVALNDDIRVFPELVYEQTDRVIVLGDLHGNAMKLLYLLLRFDVISLDEALFRRAWEIYDKNTDELTAEDITQFEQLIAESKITESRPGLLSFIGDEFADRGKNDFFTALIFKRLHDAAIPYQIHLSNHGTYLLCYLETGKQQLTKLKKGQLASLDNLITLENKIPGVKERFRELVSHAYKDHLCLIGYIQPVGAARPYLLSHAPIDKITLENLALRFRIEYNDTSIDALISCIDKINSSIHTFIAEETFSSVLLLGDKNYVRCSRLPLDKLKEPYHNGFTHPLYETLWNRFEPRAPLLPCNCMNIHGHVGAYTPGTNFSNHTNIDSDWGKPSEDCYDPETGACSGTIPAADQEASLVFLSTVSPQDKLTAYFNAYPTPIETIADTTDDATIVSSRSSSSIDTMISTTESTFNNYKKRAGSPDSDADENEHPTKHLTPGGG